MASPQDQAEQVKTAAASIATCTPATVVLLKELVLPKENNAAPTTSTKNAKTARSTSARRNGATSRTAGSNKAATGDKAELSAKEKALLATHIINVTLRSLGDAVKAPPSATPKEPAAGAEDVLKTAPKRRIRRSNSAPMTPMQPRSINRVSTSPELEKKPARSPSKHTISAGCLSTVECARVALSALRHLRVAGKINLPQLQLELGMSSLVSKLLGLGLMEHAVKELRLLKQILDDLLSADKNTPKPVPASSTFSLAELLEFRGARPSGQVLSLVISTQMQVLRIMAKMKRSVDILKAQAYLRPSNEYSPTSLLLLSAASTKSEKDKAARLLETLSNLLLALTPSLSSSEDDVALESKLAISPMAAFELQSIALQSKLCWWRLVGHKGNIDKDILAPLSQCLLAYVRRTGKTATSDYQSCLSIFEELHSQILSQGLEPAQSSKSPLTNIHQVLAKLAREEGHYGDAVTWTEKVTQTIDPSQASAAKCCANSALLLAYRLKIPWRYPSQDELLQRVLEGLQGQLRGDTGELDDLLDSLTTALKSAMHALYGDLKDEQGKKYRPSAELSGLLEQLVYQLPRFCFRWLGKRPVSKDDTKGFIRYEQRRNMMAKSAPQVLDSALMLAKTSVDEKKMAWDKFDSLLHDCLGLLDGTGDLASVDPSVYYYAKISHLYYIQHTIFMEASKGSRDDMKENMGFALRAMRRSIECVKHRSSNERARAQILFKLERISELYRDVGRSDDALTSLQSLRNILIEDGVLHAVAEASKELPVRQAWSISKDAEQLSSALRSIGHLEQGWADWTLHLDEPERLAALEHRLEFIVLKNSPGTSSAGDQDPSIEALLELCSVDKYPVRRMRILTRLMASNIGDSKSRESFQAHFDEAAALGGDTALGEDNGLKGCIAHMKALSQSMAALACQPPDHEQIERSIATWRSIPASSTSIAHQIDDLPGLLEHLQSVADYARLSNRNNLLLDALQLASDLSNKVADLDVALDLQLSAALALQLTNVGQSTKALAILEQARQSISPGETKCREDIVSFLLSHAEYFVEVGSIEKAGEVLSQARDTIALMKMPTRSRNRKAILAQASLMYSAVALGRGDAPSALNYARNAARVLFQEWARLEQKAKVAQTANPDKSADESASQLDGSLSLLAEKSKDSPPAISGPEYWKLAHPVLRGLLFLSSIYAHLGMYQETVYYAEQAQKVAQATGSEAYLAECDAWMSFISSRAGKLEDALKVVGQVRLRLNIGDYSSRLVSLCCRLGNIYREAQDFASEREMIQAAEEMVSRMAGGSKKEAGATKDELAATIDAKTRIPIRNKRTTAATNTITRATKAPSGRVGPKRPAVQQPEPTSLAIVEHEDTYLSSLKASVLVEKASSMIHQRDWSGAWQLLQEVRRSSKLAPSILCELLTTATSLLGQSMEQMSKDAVYSVIQESTLSFPSVNSIPQSDRFSMIKTSPPPKSALGPFFQEKNAAQDTQGYLENLREAREMLLEAHTLASVMGDGREVRRTLGMLQTVVILLSAATASARKASILGHPGYATCAVEMARNLTWRREYNALLTEKNSGRNGLEWPEDIRSPETRRASLSPMVDICKFQREYIDIIPKGWSVISISLSDNRHDLCISKLQAGQSPFVIRLPLERASSRDADSDVFGFQQGRTELLDLIKRANETCHTKRDFSVKGAKTAWWAERQALDVRLGELLERIEQVWLGGFKGIFSQHKQHPKLLARFQKSFTNILDKYLPSRRQVRGKKPKATATKVTLDTRILELFVGFGDASNVESDFDEMLNDLLYFVVDILQFHGERNAYDEIDFDSMVVETMDALHSYHAEAKVLEDKETGSHTILVLDKALHTFPWESLPCMQGLAVSRVPSLACLRRLILEQKPPHTPSDTDGRGHPAGHHVSISSGTYMLNTSGDLKTTQATFEEPLSTLGDSWKRVIKRAPTEPEFEAALSSSDIVLYMGHGGGAQYIRNRTIRRLDKCRATALLMGCSSASLSDVGDFECYGLVWSYMLAGCPAVVGTLWDVTDRDIDLYTGRVYEEWGLVTSGTFLRRGEDASCNSRQKGKAISGGVASGGGGSGDDAAARDTKRLSGRSGSRDNKRGAAAEAVDGDNIGVGVAADTPGGGTACEYGDASLPEAVARARTSGVCKFKYLNAAAVCVYGIPVYVDRGRRQA
jgi:separase